MNIYAKIGIGLGVVALVLFVSKKTMAKSNETDGIGDFQEPDGFNAPNYQSPSGSPLPSDVEINYKKTGRKSSDGRDVYLDLKTGREGLFDKEGGYFIPVVKKQDR